VWPTRCLRFDEDGITNEIAEGHRRSIRFMPIARPDMHCDQNWPLCNGYPVDILLGMSKVLITVPDELLDRIDRAAKARKTTRSRFIEEAAQRELGWPAADSMDAAVNRAREALASAGPFESAGLIRRDREARDAARR
jgi:predicted transcriptional regulator